VKTAFDKAMADEWRSRALAHAIYGGADFGECTTTAGRVAIGDADSWYREWNETADRVSAIAEALYIMIHATLKLRLNCSSTSASLRLRCAAQCSPCSRYRGIG
jgi:hypothetical protein